MKTPLSIYQQNISASGFVIDNDQTEAINTLNTLFLNILAARAKAGFGLYLWGRVGRGKTYVMDCFFTACETDEQSIKIKRIHYYRFMQLLHTQLTVHQGKKDPLVPIAKELSQSYQVLCLDEFFVSDIADAMLLGRLLKILFEQGLIIVATSNVAPQDLYKEGLQRDRFLPAIVVLEHYLTIIHMAGPLDHRLSKERELTNYLIEPVQQGCLAKDFASSLVYQRFIKDVEATKCSAGIELGGELIIESRPIECLAKCARFYCFSFEQLFVGPRSSFDYIALSKIADVIYILNVQQLGGLLSERKVARGTEDTVNINRKVADRPFVLAKGDDEARRFISFIDEMYDQRRKVVIGCEVELQQMYLGGRVEFEFERTTSRIVEMQSAQYNLC